MKKVNFSFTPPPSIVINLHRGPIPLSEQNITSFRHDRSEEEQAIDRLSVQDLIQTREKEPEKLHFIRRGTVHTRDKAV